jgi:hypothetical protein
MEQNFQKFIQEYNLTGLPIYDIASGKCVLSNDGKIALVLVDGRYPKKEEGYSINKICTEEINVLHGGIILENPDLHILKEGDKIAILPNKKYSISGKAICLIKNDPPWDKTQNSFTS